MNWSSPEPELLFAIPSSNDKTFVTGGSAGEKEDIETAGLEAFDSTDRGDSGSKNEDCPVGDLTLLGLEMLACEPEPEPDRLWERR